MKKATWTSWRRQGGALELHLQYYNSDILKICKTLLISEFCNRHYIKYSAHITWTKTGAYHAKQAQKCAMPMGTPVS